MSRPDYPSIELEVGRGSGLHLEINGRLVEDAYGVLVMAELAALREQFPAVRVAASVRCRARPKPAALARLISTELDRNEIWD